MALKRKRSSQSFSSPSTTGSDTSSDAMDMDTSSIPFTFHGSEPVPSQQPSTWSWPTYDDQHSTHHLNSRTRKRHRDNRPGEAAVYGASWLGAVINMSSLADACRCAASTIQRLYDAQRAHPHAAPIPSTSSSDDQFVAARCQQQKSTLHSFWQLPSRDPAPLTTMMMEMDQQQSNGHEMCEDCDRALRYEDAMELDARILEQEMACSHCRRQVCDTCAVLGNERICLACASGR